MSSDTFDSDIALMSSDDDDVPGPAIPWVQQRIHFDLDNEYFRRRYHMPRAVAVALFDHIRGEALFAHDCPCAAQLYYACR